MSAKRQEGHCLARLRNWPMGLLWKTQLLMYAFDRTRRPAATREPFPQRGHANPAEDESRCVRT
eukprot:3975518-Lingulodinium_polyedra.AAC.1